MKHFITAPASRLCPEKNRRIQGFTLIELMAVIAIISILVLLAIPAYSNYMVRSKISEGLGFAAEAQTSVTEAYLTTGNLPISNYAAGLRDPNDYDRFTHVSRLEVSSLPVPGAIIVTIKIPSLGSDNLLQFIPSTVDGQIAWVCRPAPVNGVDTNKLPANCRN